MNYILCVINYFLVADVYLICAALFFSSYATVRVIIVIKRVLCAHTVMNRRMHPSLWTILSLEICAEDTERMENFMEMLTTHAKRCLREEKKWFGDKSMDE